MDGEWEPKGEWVDKARGMNRAYNEAATALIRQMAETVAQFPSHLTAPPETREQVMDRFFSDLRELIDDYEYRWKTAE